VAETAVIFDVDGVLLELTRDEEEIFFDALANFLPTESLSRDWNSYKIRNDEDIIAEILQQHQLSANLSPLVIARYLALLHTSATKSIAVAGAAHLLKELHGVHHCGIATANLLGAAQHRLQQAELWSLVAAHAHGADGGGHKMVILGRALAQLQIPASHVVYVGDNIYDVEAGLSHGVHFIGFSRDAERCEILRAAGACHISTHHQETMQLISTLLA
jgi:phosphoglycolate phosphatase-like HAD superfamily hydrolase